MALANIQSVQIEAYSVSRCANLDTQCMLQLVIVISHVLQYSMTAGACDTVGCPVDVCNAVFRIVPVYELFISETLQTC